MAISKEIENHYESRIEMFQTQGWAALKEEIDNGLSALNTSVWAEEDPNLILRMQGYRSALQWLSTLEEATEVAYQSLIAQEIEEQMDEEPE